MRRISLALAGLVLVVGISVAPSHLVSRPATNPDFVHFESSHVHPVTLTPDGNRLLVVNTPDNRLSVFDVTGDRLVRVADIPVGLEPVSVAALSDSEAWVVNSLSDNLSIVSLTTANVRATVRVGDEPSDVVFAGTPVRAYVSVSQEDVVRILDPTTLVQVGEIPINGRMPRSLARDASGAKVFAAVFNAGNRTSVLSAFEVADSIPDDPDFPRDTTNKHGHAAPAVGGIVQQFNGNWFDEYGKLWNSKVKYSMPDVDVAEISTSTNTVTRSFSGLGSVNYAIDVSPVDGKLAVAGTEARNGLRFENKMRGYMVDTRIAYVTVAGAVTQRLLNPHINYSVSPGPQAEVDSAIGIPTAVAWSSSGQRAYVAAFANDKVAVLNPAASGSITQMLGRVSTVAGPSGLVVDDARGRLYVVGRFHNQIQSLSISDFSQLDVTWIGFDPTPDAIVNGRKFFYGGFTSGHGDQSCATCHIFGDMDNLAWDLGNPFAEYVDPPDPNPLNLEGFDPMKGPMTTQSLRGMTNTEPLHWRGDRVDLAAFNPAFVGLLGRGSQLPDSEITAFSDFTMPLAYPPNPYRNLDRTLPDPIGQPNPLSGETFFMNQPVLGVLKCNDCHTAASFGPGTNRVMVPDDVLFQDQDMKVPQLRNLYRKTGYTGDSGAVTKRGFGYTHDGTVDNLFNFMRSPQFDFGADTAVAHPKRRDVASFLLAFDTGMAPAVGHQVTFDGTPNLTGVARLDTLKGQAALDYCDVVAKGRVAGVPRGWVFIGSDSWQPDSAGAANILTADLIALAGPGSEITFTGVPEGSGQRMGIDRDRDTYLDLDELIANSDPGNPLATPANVGVLPGGVGRIGLERVSPNPFRGGTEVWFAVGRAGKVELEVYDLMGREVRVLVRGWRAAGRQSVRWDGRRNDGGSAGSGVYFVRLRSEEGQWTRPVVRIQ